MSTFPDISGIGASDKHERELTATKLRGIKMDARMAKTDSFCD
jgi:hypothetical protein